MAKLPSSYRRLFMTINHYNDTKSELGLVTYTHNQLMAIVKEWNLKANFKYCAIEHTETANPHTHIFIQFAGSYPTASLMAKFPVGQKESVRNPVAVVQYLIHLNDSDKKQYKWEDIETNYDDLEHFKTPKKKGDKETVEEYIKLIAEGKIKRFNINKIPVTIYSKYKSQINNAIEWKEKEALMSIDRNITVMFIQGMKGSGKTTLAKFIAKGLEMSICVSSGSNDPLQDYGGQECLILDDMRDSVMKMQDFLKLTDNNTLSSTNSRYNNKLFTGSLIIITSTVPVTDWYIGTTDEQIGQFTRRINAIFHVSDDGKMIVASEFDKTTEELVDRYKYPNPAYVTYQERQNQAMKIMSVLGVEPIEDMSADKTTKSTFEESQVKMDEWKKLNK